MSPPEQPSEGRGRAGRGGPCERLACPQTVAGPAPRGWGGRGRLTHDSILHAEAQLVLEVRPLDEHRGDRGTADDVQLHLRLVLQTLWGTGECSLAGRGPGHGGKGRGEAVTSGPPFPLPGRRPLPPTRTQGTPGGSGRVAHCAPVCPLTRAEAAAQSQGPGCDAARAMAGTRVTWAGPGGALSRQGVAPSGRATGTPFKTAPKTASC